MRFTFWRSFVEAYIAFGYITQHRQCVLWLRHAFRSDDLKRSSERSLLYTGGRWYPISRFSSGFLCRIYIASRILRGQYWSSLAKTLVWASSRWCPVLVKCSPFCSKGSFLFFVLLNAGLEGPGRFTDVSFSTVRTFEVVDYPTFLEIWSLVFRSY